MSRVHRIDLDQFDQVVAAAKQYEKTITETRTEIAQILNGLPGFWEGTAADTFRSRVMDWDNNFEASQDELKRLRVAGESIISNYRNAFRANAEMLRGL